MDADGGVGGAGAAGDEAEAGLSGELAVGFGHEGRAAFVAGVHELEPDASCMASRSAR
jgi:hypothetical protein